MNESVSFFGLLGRASKTVLLLIYALFALFPLVWMIITSLRYSADIFALPVRIIPEAVT